MAETAGYLFGTVRKSRGLKGELLISLIHPDIKLEKRIGTVWLGDDPDHLHPRQVESLCLRGSSAILKLSDVNSREQADYLKDIKVFVSKSTISRNQPIWLIGFKVFAVDTRKLLGKVTNVDFSGVQQKLVVATDNGEFILPFVDEFVRSIDTDNRRIEVQLIDGMDL